MPTSVHYEHVSTQEDGDIEVSGIGLTTFSKDSSESDLENTDNMSDMSFEDAKDLGISEERSTLSIILDLFSRSSRTIITYFLFSVGNLINLSFAGHYDVINGGSSIFAGFSLANMFSNMTMFSIMVGMTTAIDTLGSQYNGSGNYVEVGFLLQRSIVLLSFIAIPLIISWTYAGAFFDVMGVEKDVVDVIQTVMSVQMLTIPATVIGSSYNKYLFAMGVVNPPLFANIAQALSLFLLNYLFVYHFHFSYVYIAISSVIGNYTSMIVQLTTSWYHPSVQRTLQPLSFAAFRDWGQFIKLGIPGTLMICSEWWAYEVLTFFASQMGTAAVSAQSIMMQVVGTAFMIPLGLGISVSSLIGNALGGKDIQYAVKIGQVVLCLTLIMEILIGTIVYLCGDYIILIFTQDPETKQVTYSMMPFLGIFIILDGIQGVSSGVFRGTGKQAIGAMANIIAFYVIGLPFAWVLGFHTQLGVRGLIFGTSIGTGFQSIAMVSLILCKKDFMYTTCIELKNNDLNCSGYGEVSQNPMEEGLSNIELIANDCNIEESSVLSASE
jgi:MATE family multidrug resistance protein